MVGEMDTIEPGKCWRSSSSVWDPIGIHALKWWLKKHTPQEVDGKQGASGGTRIGLTHDCTTMTSGH